MDNKIENQPTNSAREPEVLQQINKLRMISEDVSNLSHELIERLASVIRPVDSEPKGLSTAVSDDTRPTTPLATNMNGIFETLLTTKKSMLFILKGLEL